MAAIGTFGQWRTAVDNGELRRVTWVTGDQPILIEEVIDTTKDKLNVGAMDYVSLSVSATFERDVWAEANQHPLTPGANRLILIRDADKLRRWTQLGDWLGRTRTLPGVYLVFVSDDPKQIAAKGPAGKTMPAHIAQLKAPRGFIVKCGGLSEADALAWVRRRAPLDEPTAQYLLTRTGGNLAAAAATCAKLRLFSQSAGAAAIDALTTETPTHNFTDNLIALNKRPALMCLADINDTETSTLIVQLDHRLDLLERLNRIYVAGRHWRDISGVSPFLVRQYMPHARHYDTAACAHRRRVLAVIDDALRNGARDGVLQALVALW